MVKQPKTTDVSTESGPEKVRSDSRQARLDAALRENLKRRKRQTRARTGHKSASNSTTSEMPDTPDPGPGAGNRDPDPGS